MIPDLLLIITIAGAFYLALAIAQLCAFGARRIIYANDEFAPSVTILKPIAGNEPQLYDNLASFCNQDYPEFEVVFCLHADADPALPAVERVAQDFPNARPRIAMGDNAAMANPKIANLAKPGAEPSGEIVVIADSDVRVGRDYLRTICAEFATECTVATTCLYRGAPSDGIVARLGAAHIEGEFAPSVLVALALGPLRFCLGATMAVRKTVLDGIGGLAALGPYLADDHELGERASKFGDVVLSRYVVETDVSESSLAALWSHELRWARTHRAQAPAGYFFSFIMYALPLALLYVAVARNMLSAIVLAFIIALRVGVHAAARNALCVRRPSDWWLIPARDFLSIAIWLASLFGRSVRWREIGGRVTQGGRFEGSSS